ncbi:hypothetical protein TSUD_57640 [Trifolium subterraneum]|uniref:Aminotransferase-like plant mobile domain-containing protein n=1 Tax=Trifolium subterraneum TaxID=3900 RepID=A0A2Z6MKP5_TRISU|nr:hypothetical protein TSUD_57640 [Trifolium subterraneum]
MHCVVRTRGRDGRIRHAGVGRGVSIPVEQEQEIEQPVFVEQPMMQEDEDVAQHGWPGGPLDTSILTRYSDHERIEGPKPELRIASLGTKLTGWVDPQLLSAFTERWHPETSSFHMPFGEMTITLDDVACLLHIPVRGIFYTPVPVSMEEAAALAKTTNFASEMPEIVASEMPEIVASDITRCSIVNTVGNKFNNFIESGCAQKISLKTLEPSSLLLFQLNVPYEDDLHIGQVVRGCELHIELELSILDHLSKVVKIGPVGLTSWTVNQLDRESDLHPVRSDPKTAEHRNRSKIGKTRAEPVKTEKLAVHASLPV